MEQETDKAIEQVGFGAAAVLVILGVVGFGAAVALAFSGLRAWVGLAVTAALGLSALAAYTSRHFKSLAFTIWVVAFIACALFYPDWFISWRGYELKRTIPPLVQLILFCMGMTLTFEDFGRVFKMPKAVLVGFGLQYTIMPIMAVTFAKIFRLEAEVAVGLILIGSCPGGVSSNVITYIAGANVALSVTMTACSTLLSPIMTPLAVKLLAGQYVRIETGLLVTNILKLVIAPLVAGLLLNRYAGRAGNMLTAVLPPMLGQCWIRMIKVARRLVRVLPALAMVSICIIIGITVGVSRNELLAVALALFCASACHSAAGFSLGYFGARALGMDRTDSKTVAIEVGMQNGGMATGLAFNVFDSSIVAMASAVFGPWSAIAGSALASFWRRRNERANAAAPAERDRYSQ
jgi:BASS family bile acid:Na+ symporter